MRRLCLLLAILAVAGCNKKPADSAAADAQPAGVSSRRPLLTGQGPGAAPTFKSGVWLRADVGCKVDEKALAKAWPDCADWTVIALNRIVRQGFDPKGDPADHSDAIVIAPGQPLVMQEDRYPGGGARRFDYQRLEGVRLDGAGRIVAVRMEPIWCDRDSRDDVDAATPAASIAGETAIRAPEPIAGLVRGRGYGCTARTTRALLAAAQIAHINSYPSGKPAAKPDFHWVRDGDR